MKKGRLKLAVVGLGLQGNRLISAIAESQRVELVGTASERQRGSFRSVLNRKDVDAVVIATPNHLHAKQVIAASHAGKHILCEKPLTLSLKEAKAIEESVKKNKVHCFVNYHLRMHPEAKNAKALIAKKKLGDISYIEMHWSIGGLAQKNLPPLPHHMQWRENQKQSGGGAIMARGVHLFDILRFITGQNVREVRAWSDATKTTVDRTAVGIFILENSVPTIITTSKSIENADNYIAIYGTKNKLVLRNIFTDSPHKMYVDVFDAFAGALRGKKTFLATLEDGIAAVEIADAFISSSQHKRAKLC